jgi:hypothetical protein
MAETPEVRKAPRDPNAPAPWYKRSAAWRRIGADLAALAVGGNAAVLSWGHIVHTSILLHQGEMAAWLYPVSIDGMMIVGVVKAADDRATGRKVRWWARVATWLGGGLSINAQMMSAWTYGYLAAAWSVVPAVTLIVVVEVQSRRGKLIPPVVPAMAPETAPVVATTPAVTPAVVAAVAEPVVLVEPADDVVTDVVAVPDDVKPIVDEPVVKRSIKSAPHTSPGRRPSRAKPKADVTVEVDQDMPAGADLDVSTESPVSATVV